MHHLNCFVAKAKNNVTVPFLFCRKHTIQRMSRIWHLPSRVGNAYDCPYSGTNGVLKNCVFHPGVTVATLCWWFGNQQGLIFSRFLRCHNCGGSLLHFFLVIEEFNPCKKSSYWGTFWHFTSSFFSGKKLHQKDWIIGIQFYCTKKIEL